MDTKSWLAVNMYDISNIYLGQVNQVMTKRKESQALKKMPSEIQDFTKAKKLKMTKSLLASDENPITFSMAAMHSSRWACSVVSFQHSDSRQPIGGEEHQ
jgi:hypothetical protein